MYVSWGTRLSYMGLSAVLGWFPIHLFAQTVLLYLQLSSTAMGIVCQQAERSRCNCPRRRSACRCQWRCLPANTEAGILHVLRHTKKHTPVFKEAIPASKKHQADFMFFGHFLPRLSRNDHSQVKSMADFC